MGSKEEVSKEYFSLLETTENENTTLSKFMVLMKTMLRRGNQWNLMHIQISPAFEKFALYYLWFWFCLQKTYINTYFTHLNPKAILLWKKGEEKK